MKDNWCVEHEDVDRWIFGNIKPSGEYIEETMGTTTPSIS
jgi:hypothetical protein